ncbi:extracellular solute-binding protein [Lederbergia sp. NSJ-179]|uniref:extracellular solute-binding protein n=1 Tax=Lederbergia sp. NSJ-179 TaxID=2931402 RepID=UPI001FD08A7C|nr:extracellular solute-binding protein [Lederbergia sp. NSJ-179]MCJ7841665.1 extracellular solute-binding protein [Lederbergia sp. NSJ-179]
MKLRVLFLLSVCIVVLSIIYTINLINQDFVLNKEDEYEDTMTIWMTTPGLLSSIHHFEEKAKIKANIKQFHNQETLLEELALAQTEGDFPDIVEVSSSYGLDEVVAVGNPYSSEEMGQELFAPFHKAILENFYYTDGLYGYPLGVELPIIVINRSILNNHFAENQFLTPFSSDESLETSKLIQDRINHNNQTKPFWLFHFDEDIPYYWEAYQYTRENSDNSFERYWTNLVKKYQLMPPLDEHMAVTRFSNMEIGALITTSSKLQMIQELIGNTFEFEVLPLLDSREPLFISGNGFVALDNGEKVRRLYQFLGQEDVQLEILQNTGWMPTRKTLMTNETFIYQLPMAKYLYHLVQENNKFHGQEVTEGSRNIWKNIQEKAKEIERSSE